MTVELVTTSSPEIVEAMERLIPQLSRSAPALTAEQCEALIAQEGSSSSSSGLRSRPARTPDPGHAHPGDLHDPHGCAPG